MRLFLFFLVLVLVLSVTRIVVLPNSGASAPGATLIVYGAPTLHLIDSPQARCRRLGVVPDEHCAAAELADIKKNGLVVARLPYSEQLGNWVKPTSAESEAEKRLLAPLRKQSTETPAAPTAPAEAPPAQPKSPVTTLPSAPPPDQ